LRWNGAIYHQIWDKIQFSFLGENSLTVTLNGRKARINGAETDVSYIAGGLTLNASAAYTDAKTKGNICDQAVSVDPSKDCSGDDDFIVTPSGTRLPVTPKFKMAATARYAWDMWTGKAHVQAGIAHQSSAGVELRQNVGDADDPVNPNDAFGRIKSSTLVDLYVGYDWSKYNLELFATNVFDDRNEISRGTACGVCRIRIIPGRPRTIGLRLGAKF
jgi:outer membrane receptor protein involved in Fe transport